ncbi:GA module, partial [Mycoplasmopsis edwardii]
MMELAYPGGVNANGTQDVINKLNAIQNSDNDDKTKMALAEKIANTFDDHNNKIKEVKVEIEKLEPSKQQVLLDKLDNAKFLHDDLNKTKEFDSLLNEVKALQDAELAEFTKGINALENLSPEEKQEFINSLPKGSSDADIKNKLKEAYKKDLENFIKKMDYPAKPDSAAQNALIQALTDNPDKYADNEKYLEELNRLKELSQLVDNANDSLNTIEGDKTNLTNEFNNADTKEKLEALLQHIADEKHKEVLAAKRAKISSIIDSLPYPEGSEAAKNELKAAYANEDLTFTQLEQKEQEIREKIEPKVSEAKKKISKLSSDDQAKLNAEFKNAGSEEKLDALLAKINEAFNNSKEAQKSVIDDLTHLSPEQKEALKNQIDQATDFADIKKIVDRAQLLDKIEEAKSIITPESYALDENPEVKAIIDETIKSLKNQIEGLTEDQVAAKKDELDKLNEKLKEYKNQIEALTENEVNNPAETKVDLAKELAKISNKDQFPNLDLEIAKAKLKKVASDLDYPGKPNNAAIKELQAQIEAVTTQEKLTELDNRIKNVLPNKIAEAKAKIAEVRDSETTTRKQDLNRQLDEADTDEEFAALFKNIEKYKAQGDAEYSGKLKECLKEQAARLPYPDSNAAAKTALERRIEEENDIAELEKLQNQTIPSMLNKINELKEEIAKRSPENIAKLNEKLNNASTPEELAAIDAEITKAINDEKAAIAAKIDALAHLTPEQKDAAKAKLDNKTYSEMDDVLERAKRDNLLALVNKLGYNDSETLPAPARTSLRGAVETTPENELDNKLTELEALKTAIENEKAEIDQINYSSDDAEGKNDLKDRLNNLTTATDVASLVTPSEVNSKLSTYKDIINDVNNPLSQTQKSDLISELDKLPKNGAESALRKEIFDAKKNAAIAAINGLPSLSEEKRNQLLSQLPSW